MSFATLDPGLQQIVSYNYDTFLKFFILFSMFALAIFYNFYYKTKIEKPTPFWTVGAFRMLLTSLTTIVLVLSPLELMLLAPEVEASNFYTLIMIPYLSMFIIFLWIAVMDFLYLAPQILLKMSGMDIQDERVIKVMGKIREYVKRVKV